jgi:hypothetical protein
MHLVLITLCGYHSNFKCSNRVTLAKALHIKAVSLSSKGGTSSMVSELFPKRRRYITAVNKSDSDYLAWVPPFGMCTPEYPNPFASLRLWRCYLFTAYETWYIKSFYEKDHTKFALKDGSVATLMPITQAHTVVSNLSWMTKNPGTLYQLFSVAFRKPNVHRQFPSNRR